MLVFAIALLLVAGRLYQGSDAELIDNAKATMRAGLTDPASATFEGLRVVKLGEDQLVSGRVNAKNRLGGYVGMRPFLYDGYAAVTYANAGTSTGEDVTLRVYREKVLACDPTHKMPLTVEEQRRQFESLTGRPWGTPPPTLGGPKQVTPPEPLPDPQIVKPGAPALPTFGGPKVIKNPHPSP